MKKPEFVNKASRAFHKVGFQMKKHSPEMFIAAGVVGTIATVVVACRATLKVHEITEKTKEDLDIIRESVDRGTTPSGASYDIEASKKDTTIVYAQTGVKFAKLYAPAVVLGTVSLGCMIKSHDILKKRNLALAAAYAAVDRGFKEYRNRVVERFGEELDRELRYNLKSKEIEETVVNEDGTESTVTKTVMVGDPTQYSDYARFFDCGDLKQNWRKDPEANLAFLKMQQAHANDLLKLRGYVFLNEVYEMLGIPKTSAGQIVGWVYDEKHPTGDNYIDFGIYNVNSDSARDFVNGYTPTILLDFNVDGEIYHRLDLKSSASGNKWRDMFDH